MERPMRCGCPDDALSKKPQNTIASYEVQWLERLPAKAEIFPGTGRIQIDRNFWSGLSRAQQQAVLAHELAHDEDPNACESCADARAGARMRYEGMSAQLATSALESVVGHRQAVGASVLYGWTVADAALKEKQQSREPGELMSPAGKIGEPPHGPRYGLDERSLFGDGQSFQEGGEDPDAEFSFGAPDVENTVDVGNGATFNRTGVVGTTKPPPTATEPPGAPASMRAVAPLLVIAGVLVVVVVLVRLSKKGAA